MSRKISLIFGCLLLLLNIAACNQQTIEESSGSTLLSSSSSESSPIDFTKNLSNIEDALSQGKLPSMESIQSLFGNVDKDKLAEVQQKIAAIINETSIQDQQLIYKNEIEKAIASQDIVKVESFDLNLETDCLSMAVPNNEKLYNNITLNLKIYYDKGQFQKDIVKESEAVQQLQQHIFLRLLNNSTIAYTLNQVHYSFLNIDHQSRFEQVSHRSAINNAMSRKQSPNERSAQTVVYDYIVKLDENTTLQASGKRPGHNRDVVLTKFGIPDDSNCLYIEVLIYAIDSIDNEKKVIDSFSAYSQEIYDMLVSDDQSTAYLSENDVSSIKIVFDIPWSSVQTVDFDFTYQS